MSAPLVYLLGWPGAGKLTIARHLAQRTGWRVVDNHLINDPIFQVVGADGVNPLPPGTKELVRKVRLAVYEAMTTIAPADLGFVLTNVLLDNEADQGLFLQVQEIAAQRGSLFLPVVLSCDPVELRRRIVSPGRAERLKPRSTGVLDRYFASSALLIPQHSDLLTLETTHLSPEQTVEAILQHLDRLGYATGAGLGYR